MSNVEKNSDTENLELSSYGERTYDGREDHKSDEQGEQTSPVSGVVDAIKDVVAGEESDQKQGAEQ